MHGTIVVEIGSWVASGESDALIDWVRDQGYLGVVIKGTQGASWSRPDYDTVYDDATGAGLLVGHLHYCEPGANSTEDEAVWLSSVVGARALALGLWLEVDELYGKPAYETAAWVNELVTAVSSPQRRAAVVATSAMFSQLAALDAATRRVVVDGLESELELPWAVQVSDWEGAKFERVGYELTSTRGLNPPAVVPPRAAVVSSTLPLVGDNPHEDDEPTDEPGREPAELPA